MLTNDERRTTDDYGREVMAIGHLSKNSGDLKMVKIGLVVSEKKPKKHFLQLHSEFSDPQGYVSPPGAQTLDSTGMNFTIFVKDIWLITIMHTVWLQILWVSRRRFLKVAPFLRVFAPPPSPHGGWGHEIHNFCSP